ncbi:LuxR family two component transcriptional regulator [Roseibium hamelinense]|uniref:LuxR family two component transcriptional regulator n=1 Tax=Roseibium hamelinense TaxID=150831 RepID=A0A562T235_9HYPH|nr:DNA-binding response regulator [Roseibium hamelinense]MTI44437.1 response regulator transcription factor [Roseibium hamelinense]TWI87403.1 LuxR family two component transcriptional regulator [Roseibium hamelinense]
MTEKPKDTVLVVDDTPETLGFLTEALERAGITVLVATSGETALSIVEKITPDIILMDAVMPGLDGFETCRKIKSRASFEHVPIIFMTGLSETEHIVHALESGGVDFLSKPINVEELQARIRVHLTNARTVRKTRVALDAAGRHIVAVSSAGDLLWTTPQIRNELGNADDGELFLFNVTLALSRRVQAMTRHRNLSRGEVVHTASLSGRSVHFYYIGAVETDEHLFRMTTDMRPDATDRLQERFLLTAREAEVLLWIANGKANKDIGEILCLSPRTVNKHLEQIFVKLGVENRASAAVRAALFLSEI